jgi:hypothetical protein
MTDPDIRALCAELNVRLKDRIDGILYADDDYKLTERADAALAQPAPEPPTEEELDALWDAQDFTRRDYRVAFARAVLARWGQGNG